ncbi:hypothetical protein LCGC14_1007070 [marine sediment metagenome]|uniref:Uncharacterized protein n=1 Tax=marine sediment metagenome TaxID=412755 RepID=A0A0F9R7J8_9ZZZZ
MNLEHINNTYGKIIWSIAGRYHMGVWEQMDVYNEILLQIFVAMKRKQIPSDESDESFMLIKGFIICKSIDIVRKENRRRGMNNIHQLNIDIEDFNENNIESKMSKYEYKLEKKFIWEMLETHLPIKKAVFIYELTFPSPETIKIAIREQSLAIKDTKLRMNVNNLRVLPKHVAESLGPEFKLNKAFMSRAKKQAREVVEKCLDLRVKIKSRYVSKG